MIHLNIDRNGVCVCGGGGGMVLYIVENICL